MINRLQAYRMYHRTIQGLLFLGGCLHRSTISRTFSYCSSCFAIFTCTTQAFIVLNFCYYHRRNLAILMKSLGRSTSALAVTIKVSCFLWNRNILMKLQQTLHDLFEEELTRNKETRTVLFSHLYEFIVPAFLFPVIVALTMLVFSYPVFKNIIHQISQHQMLMNYGMPYLGKYPWTIPQNFLYHVHFFFENCIGWFQMFTTCGVDEAFGLYAYQISSILRAMSFRLANPFSEEKFLHLLKICMKKHKQLLQCREYLEHIYGPITFWMTLTNAVLICSLLYEALPFTDFTFGKFMMLFCYTTLKLMQTFMYAWYGTTITSGSEDFRQGIYCSKWPDAVFERNVRTHIILIMLQKPMIITALKICSISVEMFVNVMNGAISYFFLLQTLQER